MSECLCNAILVRRLWTVKKDVQGLISNVRDNDIIRHNVSGRGPVNTGIMFGELSVLLLLFLLMFFQQCALLYGNGCVSECLDNVILVRRLWTVEKDV